MVKKDWEKAGKPGGTLVLGSIETDEPFVPLSVWDVDSFAKEQGIKLVRETIPKGTTDASPQLLRLKQGGAKADFCFVIRPGSRCRTQFCKVDEFGNSDDSVCGRHLG